jgi:dTDP-4-dehydrorhamnose reductase
MLRLAEQRNEVSVVADQVGSPTSALDLADGLLAVVKLAREEGRLGRVYHLAGSGRCSWADFAEELFRLSGALGGPTARVARIGTADYPTRAARPANSQLDSSAFARDFRLPQPEWNQSLSVVISRLNSDSSRG